MGHAVELELLEARRLLTVAVINPIAPVTIGAAPTTLDLSNNFNDPSITGTFVNFNTSLGTVEVQLFNTRTPLTVANFLKYVNAGLYNNTIIHRSPPGFVVQGGGFDATGTHIPTFAPVQNEPGISNTAGTIAMAKVDGDPNSATSEWFFNVGNNSQTLDQQNGGFTVFGQVIQGLGIVDSINQLPTTTATLGTSTFTNLPVVNLPSGAQPTTSNLVNVSSVQIAPTPVLKILANVANPSLLTADISGNNLIITPTPGRSGFTSVTITATGLDGVSASSTFRVHVTGSATQTQQVVLGAGSARSISFRDASNLPASVSYSGPGTATLNFIGNSITATGGSIRGTNLQLDSVSVTGSTAASTLSIGGSSAKQSVQIGTVTINGSLSTLRVRRGTLESDLNITGSLRKLQVDNASDGNITIGAGSKLSILGTGFSNEGLTSAASIAQLKVANWVNADATQPVTAPSIDRIVSSGNFTPGLKLTGTVGRSSLLRSIVVSGLIGGVWNIPGKLPTLKVGGTSTDFDGTFTAPIGSLRLGTFSGRLTVPSIRNLRIVGSMTGGALVLTAPLAAKQNDLGKLTVIGQISQSSIISTGNIGSIAARGIISSGIYAGVASVAQGTQLPGAASDFSGHATIGSVSSRKIRTTEGFVNSNIAAWTLGNISVGTTATTNNGVPFGLAANSIASFTAADTSRTQSFHLTRITSAADLAAVIAAKKLTLADLRLVLIA